MYINNIHIHLKVCGDKKKTPDKPRPPFRVVGMVSKLQSFIWNLKDLDCYNCTEEELDNACNLFEELENAKRIKRNASARKRYLRNKQLKLRAKKIKNVKSDDIEVIEIH